MGNTTVPYNANKLTFWFRGLLASSALQGHRILAQGNALGDGAPIILPPWKGKENDGLRWYALPFQGKNAILLTLHSILKGDRMSQ